MHLVFIRHGDPDYEKNSLTEKGWREAECLSKRVVRWKIDGLYVSPYGRAQDTAKPFLDKIECKPETLPWLKEFDYKIKDPRTKKQRGCWDWLPHEYFSEKKFFGRDSWLKTRAMKSGNINEKYAEVCKGLDDVMKRYGYEREDAETPVYKCKPHLTAEEASVDKHLDAVQENFDDRNIVFVCHLGVMFAAISWLTGCSPLLLWQGFFVAPTSVTVLGAEERVPGEVVFRVQQLGDVRHLHEGGEPISASGFFGSFVEF